MGDKDLVYPITVHLATLKLSCQIQIDANFKRLLRFAEELGTIVRKLLHMSNKSMAKTPIIINQTICSLNNMR